MTEGRPTREFGKRKPVAAPTATPVKRSSHVGLLMMGTLAVGGGAYALMPRQNCQPTPPGMAAPAVPQGSTGWAPRGSSGGGYGSSSRYSFFGGDSSSNRSSSATSSDTSSGGVTRGGFGSFARAFGFSGGG
jgi:hypothetical protein